jgi:hypothetical protein
MRRTDAVKGRLQVKATWLQPTSTERADDGKRDSGKAKQEPAVSSVTRKTP